MKTKETKIYKERERYNMKFTTSFRYSEDTKKEIRWLLENFPDKFFDESHLIRCAIIILYNKEREELRK